MRYRIYVEKFYWIRQKREDAMAKQGEVRRSDLIGSLARNCLHNVTLLELFCQDFAPI